MLSVAEQANRLGHLDADIHNADQQQRCSRQKQAGIPVWEIGI
jgi:hypothetical protein